MEIINIRYGFDVDNLSSKKTPLHYDRARSLLAELAQMKDLFEK